MRLSKVVFYSFLLIAAAGYFKTVSASMSNPAVFLAKLQKAFQNQQLIDVRLKNIESLTEHIRLRVYRKTGFYH